MYRESTTSNITQALRKSINMDIRLTGTLNQLFIRNSYSQMKLSEYSSKRKNSVACLYDIIMSRCL